MAYANIKILQAAHPFSRLAKDSQDYGDHAQLNNAQVDPAWEWKLQILIRLL